MTRTAYCFDLDGTITGTELLPCIASELGIAEEMSTLTRLTMDGLIGFEESMRLRCLILGQVPIPQVHAIVDEIPIDADIANFIAAHPDDCYVVTGNLDVWVAPLLARLGCTSFTSRATISNGRLRIDHLLDKGEAVREIIASGRASRAIAIGDGANDVSMLAAADIGIAFGGVHAPAPATIKAANYVIHDGSALCRLLKTL